MYKILAVLLILLAAVCAFADPLVWNLPGNIGTIGLPFQSTESLYGYDFVLKQNIVGASLPVIGIKNLLFGEVGAAGVFGSQSLNVQPYLGMGLDLLRLMPTLKEFESLHFNGFGRYATDQGKFGGGVSVSYTFGPTPPTAH